MLAERLVRFAGEAPLVLALPRGGVPVALEVARALAAPLEVFVVRKIGAPFQPELGIGAVAEDGTIVVDHEMCELLGVDEATAIRLAIAERGEAQRRVARYRGRRPLPELAGRTVIVVDDGVATGGTARAALRALRARRPRRLIFAAPVAELRTLQLLAREADEVVAALAVEDLGSIGAYYDDFHQLGDEEVLAALRARAPVASYDEVRIPAGGVLLAGTLSVPAGARGVVLFAHGSGSSRRSPRNQRVAAALREAGLATLLFDLLTPEEASGEAPGLDIARLAARLVDAIDWIARQQSTRELGVGCFGASTGAAAALIAAAERPELVQAVVARSGRVDLAAPWLPAVRAPTLCIVGGADEAVLELNALALRSLGSPSHLAVIPRASHLFEEPGALDEVARLAAGWFGGHLAPRGARAARR